MSETLLRVAKRMAEQDSGPEGSDLFDIHWREFGDGYLASARTAVEALRDLDDEQISTGWYVLRCAMKKTKSWTAGLKDAHRAMLDKVLEG